tara:strand:- start:3466 stop:3642 length:177 start_codon:yes stop_codon:yes gene_type:complete
MRLSEEQKHDVVTDELIDLREFLERVDLSVPFTHEDYEDRRELLTALDVVIDYYVGQE